MSAVRTTPVTPSLIVRRNIALLAVLSMLGLVAVGAVTAGTTPAGAAAPSRTGATAESAAPSCYSIKQSYPASTDGTYWLWTPKLIAPEQFYCDMTTAGGGWVLVGRGREAWSFQYSGQGSPSTVRDTITGPDAFAPAALSTPIIDALMNGGRMDALTDGIRLRRATNPTGTTWQEARMRVKTYGSWSWAFGGGIYLSSVTFDGTTTNLGSSNFQSNTTANVQLSNDTRRINTTPQSGHNLRAGFSFGSNVTNGSNSSTSYLWEFANENSAIPFTQVFIRPTITEADIVGEGVSTAPDSGLSASTVRAMLDHRPTPQPWGTTGINNGTSIPSLNANVTAFADIGNTIYVGGKFLQVQHGPGGPTFDQPYLAAFDKTTGEWIPSFNPVINAPIWKIMASPDGTKLFVGGEFTSVNGQANTTGLAALDPATGAPVASWSGYVQRTTGLADVRAMDIQGGFLYVGGLFNRVAGGIGTQAAGPIVVGRLARLRISDGRPDGTWKPNVETAPQELDASARGDRVYVVGLFKTLNGVTLSPTRFAVIDTTTAELVPGLSPIQPNSGDSEWMNTVMEVGDKVYLGGSQHFIHQYNRSDMAFERSHMTKNGGDYQAMAFKNGILYGACHCNDWQYQDANTWLDPSGYTEVNPINMIGAYDTTDNFEVMPEYHTTQLDLTGSGGEGPWELFIDANGCMWAGGDLVRLGTTPSPFYGGFERFCEKDSTAPSVPSNPQAAVTGSDVTLSWNPATDNAATPIRYEVLKDDPTFGTIVMGTTFDRNLTDDAVAGPTRYFVRAVDAEGNRSATTSVISVNEPPSAATLLASGAGWSYNSSGANLGTSWRSPSFDAGSWPTGASQLGWGDGDEATVVPSGPITQYYVRHFDVADPDPHQLLSVRLKRDDGAAVYINGVEVVRDNLPPGALTSSTWSTTAVFGADENTWHEFSVPGDLLVAGDNVIAVEVHQNTSNNGDSSFDLELLRKTPTEHSPPSRPELTLGNAESSSISFSWAASTDDTGILGYLVRSDGTTVGFTASTTFTDTGLSPGSPHTYEVVAIDQSGNASLPGSLTASTTASTTTIIDFGAGWDYRFDGINQGTAWIAPGFDDSTWASGSSELGIGDADEATVIGPTTTPTPITAYFRRTFEVTDLTGIEALTLDVVRDDGFVAYLNGVEIARNNMPAGPISYSTRPLGGIAARIDETTPVSVPVPVSALHAGNNTIAVEMHQANNSSNDLSFNLRLEATLGDEVDTSAPLVAVTDPVEGTVTGSTTPVIAGTCTESAGTVSVAITGAATATLTTPCVAGAWSTSSISLGTGAYAITATQTNGAGNTGSSPARNFQIDATGPVTTDNTATIGNAWRSSAAIVTLTAADAGVGVAQTYSTVDGQTPTTASATGSTISLTTEGLYTIRYFSVDALGNAEAVTTAGTQIRIDQSAPTGVTTFPVGGGRYNATSWPAGCGVVGICGTASDALSGVASVSVTVQRQSNNQYWNGSAWQSASVALPATGTTSWTRALPVSALTNGAAYTVTTVAIDAAGNASAPSVSDFTYDTSRPTTAAGSITVTNKNGAVNQNVDTFSVTFNEAIDPASVPATGTLTLTRRNSNTSWGISGLTNGTKTTGTNGYLTSSSSTRTVTFAGSFTLNNGNRTISFTVTGACSGSCSSLSTTARSGRFQYQPATTIRDLAGNAPSTSTITASSSSVMF